MGKKVARVVSSTAQSHSWSTMSRFPSRSFSSFSPSDDSDDDAAAAAASFWFSMVSCSSLVPTEYRCTRDWIDCSSPQLLPAKGRRGASCLVSLYSIWSSSRAYVSLREGYPNWSSVRRQLSGGSWPRYSQMTRSSSDSRPAMSSGTGLERPWASLRVMMLLRLMICLYVSKWRYGR